ASIDKYELVEPQSNLEDPEELDVQDDDEESATKEIKGYELTSERVDKAVIDLVRMYDEKELILRPDWQRYYVSSNKQASQLVESLFLKLPIPLIYLAEEDDGTFSVVDGQQRLTALIEFVRNQRVDPLKTGDVTLSGLEVLTELDGKTFAGLSPRHQ